MFASLLSAARGGSSVVEDGLILPKAYAKRASEEEVGVDIIEAMDIFQYDLSAHCDKAVKPDSESRSQQSACQSDEVSQLKQCFRHASKSLSQSSSGVFSDKQLLYQERARRACQRNRRNVIALPLPVLPGNDFKHSSRCKRVHQEFAITLTKEFKGSKVSREMVISESNLLNSALKRRVKIYWNCSSALLVFHSNESSSDAIPTHVFITSKSIVALSEEHKRALLDAKVNELDVVLCQPQIAPLCLIYFKSPSNSCVPSARRWFSLQLPSVEDLQSLLSSLELCLYRATNQPQPRPLFQYLPFDRLLGKTNHSFDKTFFYSPLEVSYLESQTSKSQLYKESCLMFKEYDDVLGTRLDKWQTGNFMLKLNTLFLSCPTTSEVPRELGGDAELPHRFWILNDPALKPKIEALSEDHNAGRPHSFRLTLSNAEVFDISTSCSEERDKWMDIIHKAIKFKNCDTLQPVQATDSVLTSPKRHWQHPVLIAGPGAVCVFHFRGDVAKEYMRFGRGRKAKLLDCSRINEHKMELLFYDGSRLQIRFPNDSMKLDELRELVLDMPLSE